MNQNIDEWYQSQFLPWKQQAEAAQIERGMHRRIISNKANQLKYLVALLYDGEFDTAKNLWNTLELGPKVAALSLRDDVLVIGMEDGTRTAFPLTEVIMQFTQELRQV